MAQGKLDVKPLISHQFPFEEAEKAYDLITENKEPYLGIILDYDPQISQITQKEKEELATPVRSSGPTPVPFPEAGRQAGQAKTRRDSGR